jgi:hypothetical protein
VTGRQGRRRTKLLDNLKEKGGTAELALTEAMDLS